MWLRGARVSMPAARTCRPALAASLRSAYRRMATRAPLSVMHRGCGGWPSCGHRHGVRGWAQVLRVSPIRIPIKGKCGISHQTKSFLDRPHCISLYEILTRKSRAVSRRRYPYCVSGNISPTRAEAVHQDGSGSYIYSGLSVAIRAHCVYCPPRAAHPACTKCPPRAARSHYTDLQKAAYFCLAYSVLHFLRPLGRCPPALGQKTPLFRPKANACSHYYDNTYICNAQDHALPKSYAM